MGRLQATLRTTSGWAGILLWAAAAQAVPLPRHANPRRAERARQLVLSIAPEPADGGELVDGYEFWWIGAKVSGAAPNSGAQTILQEMDIPPDGPGCFDCYVSEFLDNNYWGQVGFSTCTGQNEPNFLSTFYQVWDTNPPGTLLVDGESEVTAPGLHTYAMVVKDGTTWEYSVDGVAFGSVDMLSNSSSAPGAISTLCEEGDGVIAAFVPHPVSAPVAMSILQDGVWSGVTKGVVYNSAGISGVVGTLQDSSLASGAVRIGGDAGTDDTGTTLWSDGSTAFAPDAGPAGRGALIPPLVTLTSPIVGSTVSGTVTLSGTISVADGGRPIEQVSFFVEDINGNHYQQFAAASPPYIASWDTTTDPNGAFYVAIGESDALGHQTYAEYVVTIDNSGAATTGSSGGTTGTATGGPSGTGGTTGSSSSRTSTGFPQGTIGGTPTDAGGSRGCASTGGVTGVLAALIGVAWLTRPKQRRTR